MVDRAEREQVERVEQRRVGAADPGFDQRGERVERVERRGEVWVVPELRRGGEPDVANVNVSPPPARAAVSVAPDYAALAVAKVSQILWFLCAVLELLLGLRVALLLMGVNRAAPFAAFLLSLTQPFAWPFLGLLPNPAAPGSPPGSVFEITTLVAMVVYFLFFLFLTQLLRLLVSRPRVEV